MKNALKRIFAISFIVFVSFLSITDVISIEMIKSDKLLRIYDIKEKEEVLVENNKIIDFYEETHEEIELLIEEKREQQRIEEEKKRLENGRRRQYSYVSYDVVTSDSEIANFAQQFVGNPYVYGGTSLTNGADCSGFVQAVYANFGIYLPRTTYEQAYVGSPVDLDSIKAGDIVSYSFSGINPDHSALYIGNGLVIHASTPALGIRIDSLYSMPIYSVRRVV